MAHLVDTHCHLDLRQFDHDREAVLIRSAQVGVTTIVNPAIDLASCRRVLALADHYDGVYAAVGVHPNDCADFDDDTVVALRELAQHPKVVAIGEIGLDYYWNKVAIEQQLRALRAQLALAAELSLPIILHSRSAQGDESRRCNADLLGELRRWRGAEAQRRRGERGQGGGGAGEQGSRFAGAGEPINQLTPDSCSLTPVLLTGIWHAFSGDLAEAQAAYDLRLALGLGGPVTFQNARRLHSLIPQLRPDRLLLETDAPYLAPHPHRGQRNEPAYVPLIAEALAKLFGVTPEVVASQTTATACHVFGKGVGYGQDG